MFPPNRNHRRRNRIATISAEVLEARRVLSAMTGGVSSTAAPETLIECRAANEQNHERDLTAHRSEREAKDTFEPTKPHMNVGTIGHIRESIDSTGRQGVDSCPDGSVETEISEFSVGDTQPLRPPVRVSDLLAETADLVFVDQLEYEDVAIENQLQSEELLVEEMESEELVFEDQVESEDLVWDPDP